MSGDKYKTVWIDKANAAWDTAPTPWGVKNYGPFTEAKVVPADAIVTERGECCTWIDVDHAKGYVTSALGYTSSRVEVTDDLLDRAEAFAGNLIEAVEYLRANPPVDEAEVEQITEALHAATLDPRDINVPDVARRLYLAGFRVREVTE